MIARVKNFTKRESVMVIAILLAIASSFIVKPSKEYFDYIDFRVLAILLCLMSVVGGVKEIGVFDRAAVALLRKTSNVKELVLVLIFMTFFFSMLITNDVALITFVPFSILVLRKAGLEKDIIIVVVLQTVAANLGSMLTPVGNPQNLYLFQIAHFSLADFLKIMFPYTMVSGMLLLALSLFFCRGEHEIHLALAESREVTTKDRAEMVVYLVLFILCLMTVLRIIPYYVALIIVILSIAIVDREVLKHVDYCLLFTFVAFFVFTGNLGNISFIEEGLRAVLRGHEAGSAILISQVISNVPAALFLSEFTNRYRELLVGVNLGGLGTLIASMASLISYKLYAMDYNESKGKYLLVFTAINLLFLVILLLLASFAA